MTGLLTSTRAEGRKEKSSLRFVSGVFSVLRQREERVGGERRGGERNQLDTKV